MDCCWLNRIAFAGLVALLYACTALEQTSASDDHALARAAYERQDYEQALRWLQFIFDPTISNNSYLTTGDAATSQHWVTKPFFDTSSEENSAARLRNILGLEDGDSGASARKELQCLMDKLVDDPFNVHLIARFRTTAYQ